MGGRCCLFVPGGTTLSERNRAVVSTKCSARKENAELGGWRDFRLRLIEKEGGRVGVSSRGWAHEVNVLEPGTCLISNVNHQWSETHKHRNKAVVLVTKATDTECTGLMLNRELGQHVHDIPSIEARVGREFRDNPVHLGGDCSLGTIEMIHTVPPERCPGAEEIVPGLYKGGFNASRELIQDRLADPSSFRFLLGYTQWKTEDLRREIKNKVWHQVACSTDLLLAGTGEQLWHDVLSLVGLPTAAA
ncbi:hypothetical protein NDN08_000415 [Rhodosorus marinus]|uniref:Transcriptional regulator n=1 Tax=Rhodosorus marinus TaxID=101924 RepID=A0AAV8URX2_9RHOD|nr:hypothetical protein NDN08_000415 [Rhodosorus marinus]